MQTPCIQKSKFNLSLLFPPPITLLCHFKDHQQFLKDEFFTTIPGLFRQRTDREISSKSRHQMPPRDLKLTEFKMLHSVISHFFSSAISQALIQWILKSLQLLSPFLKVCLSILINHYQVLSCWSFLSHPLFYVSAFVFESSETRECKCAYANSHPLLNLIYLVNG